MLKKNFPSRKNERRIKARERLMTALNGNYLIAPDAKEFHEKRMARIKKEITILDSRIMEPAVAKGIRTKKYRGVN